MTPRRVSTVAAGTIAAGLIACSSPGLRLAGGMMNDAGNALAGAGAAMAGAYANDTSDGGSAGSFVDTACSYMPAAGHAPVVRDVEHPVTAWTAVFLGRRRQLAV